MTIHRLETSVNGRANDGRMRSNIPKQHIPMIDMIEQNVVQAK